MTVQTQAMGTISVYREALAREDMRFAGSSDPHEASAVTYLQIADNAVESHRQARAHLALYRTEAVLLANRSPDGDVDRLPAASAVAKVRDARRAVAEGDYATASSLIQIAMDIAGR